MNIDKEAVSQADAGRRQAMMAADPVALETFLSDTLTYVHTNGVVESKQDLLAKLARGAVRYQALNQLESSVDLIGEVGVLSSLTDLEIEVKQSLIKFRSRALAVWVLEDGRWRLRRYQATMVV